MNVHFILKPEAIDMVSLEHKEGVLSKLAAIFARNYPVKEEAALELLEQREKLGSTGFGRGVAIPHARIEGIKRPIAALLRLDSAMNFDAADGMPVDLVFGLLSPANSGAGHLQALAKISRMLRDDAMLEMLREAAEPEAIYALLANVIDRDAA